MRRPTLFLILIAVLALRCWTPTWAQFGGGGMGGMNSQRSKATVSTIVRTTPDTATAREAEELLDEALKVAGEIATLSRPAIYMAKEAVNRAFETTLEEGIRFERRLFHATFALEDQKEGMAAFVEKRKPNFKNA